MSFAPPQPSPRSSALLLLVGLLNSASLQVRFDFHEVRSSAAR
jgi:hypothetical protein